MQIERTYLPELSGDIVARVRRSSHLASRQACIQESFVESTLKGGMPQIALSHLANQVLSDYGRPMA